MSAALQQFFPGSIKAIPTVKEPETKAVSEEAWDFKPRTFTVGGKDVEFFTVGQLALALGRRPVTIRKWETEGIIPKALFSAPSEDPRGRRRLYTRAQVEGIVKIAHDEGVFVAHAKSIRSTNFTARVAALFKRTANL